MKKLVFVLFGLLVAVPAFAQDDYSASGDATAEEGSSAGLPLYVGLDAVNNKISISGNQNGIGGSDDHTKMYRLRVGTRLSDAIGLEAHYGFDNSDTGQAQTDSYYGVFLVPTATLFEYVELAFPVGWAKIDTGVVSDSGLAYGANVELPIRNFSDSLPDLRLLAGYMVYYQATAARIYGSNFGVRWDFHTGNPFAGAGSWFSGVGGFFKGLWPFGDDAESGSADGEGGDSGGDDGSSDQ